MGNILDFDSAKLDAVLDQYGIRTGWVCILATHISNKVNFKYILKTADFRDFTLLESDLIDGLTIGDIGVLYEYSVARLDADSRKSNGQFFTPDDVAKFMVEFAAEFPGGRWLDPCSGIGNLSWHLVAAQDDPEEFLVNNLVLSDKDELALLIARTLFTISFQRNESRLFNRLEKNFVCFDFLSVAGEEAVDLLTLGQDLSLIPEHDFVIVNPPYLKTACDNRFETAKSSDLYAYFMENIIKSSRGFISVTPQSFTNAAKFKELRDLLLRNYSNIRIFNFDNVPGNLFKGIKFGSKNTNKANSIRAAITVALPGKGKPKITALMRWKSSERERLFSEVHTHLSSVPLSTEFFPKVNLRMEELFMSLDKRRTLGSLIETTPTNFSLHVPASPRYFIPALKSAVKRSSQHEIFFRNERDRDTAYLLINSSLMYWWWRVRDGGMTLSQETLKSLPLPEFKASKRLTRLLEESELENKVYKQNAGAAQENVKHPFPLVSKLNFHIVPAFAEQLLAMHENSDLNQ